MAESSTAHDRLIQQLGSIEPKPADTERQEKKKAYSEQVSRVVALAVAAELRRCGLQGARPTEGGVDTKSGAERRMAGGIGAKKVDVTWSTEEAGLIVAFSIKTINFRDVRTKNFQKNLTNRRGDLLFESITLHRRFPYAVLVGLFLLDEGARSDHTETRKSTFENAHERLELFKGRVDPTGRDEQYEHLYIGLLRAGESPECKFYAVGKLMDDLALDNIIDETLRTTATRNADMYTYSLAERCRPAQAPGSARSERRREFHFISPGIFSFLAGEFCFILQFQSKDVLLTKTSNHHFLFVLPH